MSVILNRRSLLMAKVNFNMDCFLVKLSYKYLYRKDSITCACSNM